MTNNSFLRCSIFQNYILSVYINLNFSVRISVHLLELNVPATHNIAVNSEYGSSNRENLKITSQSRNVNLLVPYLNIMLIPTRE
jgi:hypothetical protein